MAEGNGLETLSFLREGTTPRVGGAELSGSGLRHDSDVAPPVFLEEEQDALAEMLYRERYWIVSARWWL